MAATHEVLRNDPDLQSIIREEQHDFSLVLGGPVFQLYRRFYVAGSSGLELMYRRIALLTGLAWLPLLLLALLGASGGEVGRQISFFRDIEVQVRFLIALPILVAAELVVHSRIRPVVRSFLERRIVLPADVPQFDKAIASAVKLRNSVPLELGLLVFVYTVGLWVWNSRVGAQTATWYAMPGARWNLTPAGFWYVFVSIPLFQFLVLRWYLRLFVWYRFLWNVSRIKLNLIPTHPDRAAGLAFVGKSAYAFGPILFAQGAILAGVIASRVLYRGESLVTFKLQAGAFVAFFVLAILGPLLMFTPGMARAKRKGLREYGLLAQRYVEGFEKKWIRLESSSSSSDELLGAADIQSLADLDGSYTLVREMRSVPFGLQDISRLAAASAVPMLPLLLTIFSPDELMLRIIKVIF
ncbi:MAG: hypothetical protein ACJ71Q_08210 [Terriglobales bacterium]